MFILQKHPASLMNLYLLDLTFCLRFPTCLLIFFVVFPVIMMEVALRSVAYTYYPGHALVLSIWIHNKA